MVLFAPEGKYPPCGIFSREHLIALAICIVLIIITLLFTRKHLSGQMTTFFRVFAIIFSTLELIKIGFNLVNGYWEIYNWLPLYFCSLFIYALWLCCGKRRYQKMGCCFVFGAGFVSGVAFLIFPSTSLIYYPIFHYLSLYSLFYHSFMVLTAILIISTKFYQPKLADFFTYVCFCAFFIALAWLVNYLTGYNFMFISNPPGIAILKDIFTYSPSLYRILFLFFHFFLFLIVYGFYRLIKPLKWSVNRPNAFEKGN